LKKKWKWLLPRLSHTHYQQSCRFFPLALACVDPPVSLLPKIQAETVSFFWYNCMGSLKVFCFWLKRMETKVHLASRCAAYRLQFVQKCMLGSERLVWRPVAQCILHRISGLGLHNVFFLMNSRKMIIEDFMLSIEVCLKYGVCLSLNGWNH